MKIFDILKMPVGGGGRVGGGGVVGVGGVAVGAGLGPEDGEP